jgi:hypothetical protein
MNRRIRLAILAGAPLAVACIQPLDTAVSGGAASDQGTLPGDDSGSSALPPGFADADLSRQCPTGSALCFQLCGSPSCSLLDAGIPANLDTPVIYLPDGNTTTDPCVAIDAQAMAIREHSCAPCHQSPADQGSFDYVLNDAKLVASRSATYTDDAGMKKPMIVPGAPMSSWVYQRIEQGSMPPSATIATQVLGPSNPALKTLVSPSPEDTSVLYEWIMNCVPGEDGGAYATSYYGADYGPGEADSGEAGTDGANPGQADAGAARANGVDASVVSDSGHGPG